jgi:head-tail adaptor
MNYNEAINAGQLNRRVELFKYSMQPSPTSERIREEESLGKIWVERQEVSGTEEEEGKLIALSVAKFRMRFSQDIFKNGTQYFIRDLDGDYYVNSVAIFGGRNRFMELKCSKNG